MIGDVRDTPYACWTDPDADLERMSGPAWTRALKAEAAVAEPLLAKTAPRAITYSAAYKKVKAATEHYKYMLGNVIEVTVLNRFTVSWKFIGASDKSLVEARCVLVSPCGDYVLSTENDVDSSAKGNEDYTLTVYSVGSRRMVWFTPHVGDQVAVVGDQVYYTQIKNKLWNCAVIACDLASGRTHRPVTETANYRENYSIERGPDGKVWIGLEDSQDFKYMAIGYGPGLGPEPNIHPSTGPHMIPRGWRMPGEALRTGRKPTYGIDMVWPSVGLLITKTHGAKSLWKCYKDRPAKLLLEIPAGFIRFHPDIYYRRLVEKPRAIPFVVSRPDAELTHYRIVGDDLSHVTRVGPLRPNGLLCERRHTTSADGSTVHYIVVSSKRAGKAVRLMATGYGAYNMESATAMIKERWGPLLDAGWAVVVGFIRGGGDHTAAWGKAGRRCGRLKSWQDMEAVIRDAQRTCRIGPAHSCIYGRSAGGYLVGALLGRNPGGNLFRGVYTEVPYVDVLQTTTNPTLPLTRIEYGEFGNPGESLADFITVGLSSPALTAALVPCPAVFVLARTALNDVQVYPYETIKWVRRLREHDMGLKNSRPKLTIVSGGQGHFTPPDEEMAQHGLDAAILEELMD